MTFGHTVAMHVMHYYGINALCMPCMQRARVCMVRNAHAYIPRRVAEPVYFVFKIVHLSE